MQANRVTSLFGVQYPIVQGGMVWCSGWRLASAVSNAGGLGLVGAGSMSFDVFQHHVRRCKEAAKKPFGVNVPLSRDMAQYMDFIIEEKVPIVFTSAGSPKLWTQKLQSHGIKVVHVVPSCKLALKCEAAGVNAVVAEGFEAGGHNGLEEITTMALVPQVRKALAPEVPLLAAGGIASGEAMLAAMALGAEGVQVGTRFAVTQESSAAEEFKKRCTAAGEGDTYLTLKQYMPTRVMLNDYGKEARRLSESGATKAQLKEFRGKGRTKKGMFDGDVTNGELEIGQIVSACKDVPTAAEVVERMVKEFRTRNAQLAKMNL
ncbi:enoyl-[acyl-carrier-protein] reductase [Leishmania donovani]|uniref:Enoyl-[acyl-carrier-protein]_reductase_-_putative n=3 Tax=Leishmania donovani species complex TaxID=38574 RepID=A0A6L0XTN1_LEIIN|nr:putative enoyl-[acyl-carrier-protein] reductase [Leishmania infantum JPCM5]XP_003864228.1 enoyl-[acyl-carrier-protein] reductase, putative [Leishmania donovani]CAC9536541.1 enoyl-[acyl-carrier-protein]_reductase_-_putative [Leishmania infantum]AYU82400.1 enoyl-[acyl-carrier-protein] reductase, putative [Leishmania donovani]TPP39979.1 Nitronate monooxygenase family protein [Leishmania donovani]TPP50469.1 Nitronate monooxygenase family protein [Leishmania donovani]CAJ1992405.1 enoyl-[acyl-ca|eukprot:XP_001468450.1 putative enoyl-[acyl-carrier-protein] reductase [Leishmania infantum JPCM5]